MGSGRQKVGLQFPWGQGVGIHGPRGSREGPTESQGVRGRSKGFQGVKAWAYRVQEGQGVGLHDPRGSSGRPTGS